MNGIIFSLSEWLSRVAFSPIWLPSRPPTPTVKKLVVLHFLFCVPLVAEVVSLALPELVTVRLIVVEDILVVDLWTVFDEIIMCLAVDRGAHTSHTLFTYSIMFDTNLKKLEQNDIWKWWHMCGLSLSCGTAIWHRVLLSVTVGLVIQIQVSQSGGGHCKGLKSSL